MEEASAVTKAGPSQETPSEMEECDEQSKGELTNALKYTETLLGNLNLLTKTPPNVISSGSLAMGEAIYSEILDMLADRQIIYVEELVGVDEIDELQEYEACKGVEEDDEDFVAEEFAPVPKEYIPLWYKERAVALAAAHPKWSLKSLQGHGCSRLEHKQLLYRWKDDVKKGGTHIDKWKTIDRETYDRFLEARQNLEQIKYIKNTAILQLFVLVGGCLVTILYMSQPFLPGFRKVMELSNETRSKSLPLPADYLGLDVDVYYYYMLAYMSFFYVYGILITISMQMTFVILVQHACGMFTVVGHQLQRMANDITEEFVDLKSQPKLEPAFRHFIACIKKHNDIIEFSEILESMCTWAFLPVLGIIVVVISVAGFQTLSMTDEDPKGAIRYAAFPMVLISHQFIISLFSQKLIDHSQRIAEYLYEAEWYRTSLATQKLLSLVIMRAQVPCQLTAGKIITISMENFAVVLKTSMSYFAVMRSML